MKFLLWMVLLGGCTLYDPLPRLIRLEPPSPHWRIEHVNLFDSIAGRFLPDQTVIVASSSIVWVGADASAPVTDVGEDVLDGIGQYLLPGFIDAHVHTVANGSPPWLRHLSDPQRNLEAFLVAGITTIADLGGFRNQIFALRDKVKNGELVGPHMLAAGAHFTAPDGHPVPLMKEFMPWYLGWVLAPRFAYEVEDSGDLENAWQDFVGHQPDIVKMTRDALPLTAPKLDPKLMEQLAKLGSFSGLPVVAHIGTPEDAVIALEAGADGLAHAPYMGVFSPEQLERVSRSRKMVMSTGGVWRSLIELHKNQIQLSAMARAVLDPAVLLALETKPKDYRVPGDFAAWMEILLTKEHTVFQNLGMLYQNNVPIVIATDSPGVNIVAGDALHREMALVNKYSGVPATEILRGVTWWAARLLKIEGRAGVIAMDRPADLVLLNADPAADISNTRAIDSVWIAGRKVKLIRKNLLQQD